LRRIGDIADIADVHNKQLARPSTSEAGASNEKAIRATEHVASNRQVHASAGKLQTAAITCGRNRGIFFCSGYWWVGLALRVFTSWEVLPK